MKNCKALLLVLLSTLAFAANAGELISELGMVWKKDSITSQLLWPECTSVLVPKNVPLPRRGGLGSCGGNNPMFSGWILAYDTEWKGAWKARGGLYHMSHWFDGRGTLFSGAGDDHELYTTGLGGTITFSWTRWIKKRKEKRRGNNAHKMGDRERARIDRDSGPTRFRVDNSK